MTAAIGFYSDDYDVDRGKQQITIDGWIEHFIAPFGKRFLSSVEVTLRDDGLLELDSDTISWMPTSNLGVNQYQLIKLDQDNCNATTLTMWQKMTLASTRSLALPKIVLVDSRNYALSYAQFDDEGSPLAFSKLTFAYPPGEDVGNDGEH